MSYNVVILRGDAKVKSGVAGAAITPGALIDAGNEAAIVVHAGAGLNAEKTFALEQDYIGQGVTTNIVVGDNMQYASFDSGSEVACLIAVGAGAIVAGDYLQSAGDGTLQKFVPQLVDVGATIAVTVQPLVIVGRAREAIDNSAGSAVVRIRVAIV